MLGGIIGAGFISGKELILFLGRDGWLIGCLISALITFILTYFSFCFGYQKPNKDLSTLACQSPKFVRFVWLFFYLVVTVVLLGSIDDLLPITVGGIKIPLSSTCFLLVANLIAIRGGVQSLSKINSLLMIAVVCFLVFCTTSEGIFIDFESALRPIGYSRIFSVSVYSFFNVFLCFYPIANYQDKKEFEKSKNAKINLAVCIVSSLVIFSLSVLIIAVIYQTNSWCSPLPLIYAFGGRKTIILKVAMLCGIFTSLTTVVYSVSNQFNGGKSPSGKSSKSAKRLKLVTCFTAVLLSLADVDKVMTVGYYLSGGLGLLVFVGFVRYFFANRIKTQTKTDNSCKLKKEKTMSRKKKNKVARLTEEEYNNYLMAMKDSKPPELIIKNQKQ